MKTKTIRVTCLWETHHDVEVPDTYPGIGPTLDEEWADQVDARTAELIDWK